MPYKHFFPTEKITTILELPSFEPYLYLLRNPVVTRLQSSSMIPRMTHLAPSNCDQVHFIPFKGPRSVPQVDARSTNMAYSR